MVQAGDLAEYRAIRAAIPGSDVRINGTKSMIGHLLGAAGAVEAIATIQAIRTGARPTPLLFYNYMSLNPELQACREARCFCRQEACEGCHVATP